MRLKLWLLLLTASLSAQQPCGIPYIPSGMVYQPTVWMTYQNGVIGFSCTNLSVIPIFATTNCPSPVNVSTITTPGQTVYFGLGYTGGLHIGSTYIGYTNGQPTTMLCGSSTTCFQDAIASPYPGEFPIGIYTVGATPAITPQWTGAPLMPVVVITQPFSGTTLTIGCVAIQTQTIVQVTCQ